MEALTSSCSKATVMGLGSYFHRGAAFASNTPQICLSSVQKKGCNFRFLKLVQNKGIYPIHAVQSETWMDWDTEELEVQQENELKNIHVKFQLQKCCDFGEQFLVVGDDPMLGSWNPSNALPMTWSDDHIWTTHLNIPAGRTIQFKFLLKGKKGDIIWQPGPDRILHTWETMEKVTICEDWDNAGSQKLIQEYEHAYTYSENIVTAQELIQQLNEESENNPETDHA
ncbi:hypothetical protein Lal_00038402 [Lupinus albus]|uniref:Putative glucan 1,4-alpha-glucosidase n=1 Tax=Lupinus albus TaxID=3870 RepID=A0A6A4NSP2_LUPAL|nr:putative glucan 1,4-alpha-glucosidase [Lupinus albus]KAF1883908.1 hypothetical protein Lal_00038402 [Lupinus albus]